MDAKEFGKIIKNIRKEKNITLMDLEKSTGYSNSYLSQIENGRKGLPKPELIKKIAYGLNVSYLYLMELAGYTEHEYYIDEIFDDHHKHSRKKVVVSLPDREPVKNSDGGVSTVVLTEDELRKRLFDLYHLLNMNVDLYYKNDYLSEKDREKILTMLKIIFE